MKKLFEPVRLGNLQLKNRLVRSATWEALAAPDGSIDDRTYAIYRELAQGAWERSSPASPAYPSTTTISTG